MVKCGIIGLPNVGKSTLLNALILRHGSGQAQAAVGNFPFTTVEPNIGVVAIPDDRLTDVANVAGSARTTPAMIEVVDIAGLVKGAHRGEGLGNQFLAHIRDVDVMAEVMRFFTDPNVTHVAGQPDPLRDAEVVATELTLADLQTVEKALASAQRHAKSSTADAARRAAALGKLHDALAAGNAARTADLTTEERAVRADIRLLTEKPILYIANLDETQLPHASDVTAAFAERFQPVVPLSVKIEQELSELSADERPSFLAAYGLSHSGLDDLIRAVGTLLNLITFFTANENEARAWPVRRGTTAVEAAGKVHSQFATGFIRAETISWKTLVGIGSAHASREKGLVRNEGKDYVVQDGDVLLFKTAP